jgi:GntR family transcriptional regulator
LKDNVTRPVYLWVEKLIKKWIAEGVYSPGEKIPSERDLAQETQISRVTVRKAIENLIGQGLLERHSSSGTFVKASPYFSRQMGVERPLGLSERMRRSGSLASSTLLHFSIEEPVEKVAARLSMGMNEKVLRIRRLRAVAQQPICIETIYLPSRLVPDLYAEDLVSPDISLYDVLKKRYAITPSSSSENLRVSYATNEEADLLGINPMDPVLLMRCITYDTGGQPFEYLVSVNHPDRVIFESQSTSIKDKG